MLSPARVPVLLGLTLLAGVLTPLTSANATPVPAVLLEQVVASANDPVYLASSENADAFTFGPSTSQAGGVKLISGSMTMQIAPAPGAVLASNTDLIATYVAGSRPYASITNTAGGGTSFTCTSIAVHIKQVDRDGAGAITGFAASYKETCSTSSYRWGEIQYGAALPFGFVGQTTNNPGVFADTGVGLTRTSTVTLTSRGSAPVTLGTAAISGTGASAYSVSTDTCSGATLAPAAACTLDVTFAPPSAATFFPQVVFPADAFSGASAFALYGTGKTAPSAPTAIVVPGDDGLAIIVSPGSSAPGQGPATGFTLYRDDAPSTPLAQLPASTWYVDSPLAPGTSHSYTAVAHSDYGDSPASSPTSSTSLAPLATAGSADRFTIDIASTVTGAASYVEQAAVGTPSVGGATFTGSSPTRGITMSTMVNNTRVTVGDYVAPNAVPQVTVDSSLNPGNCPTTALHVVDADVRANGTPDVLTATYVNDCGNGNVISGSIQWHSTAQLVAASVSPGSIDVGGVLVGEQGVAQVVTVTNTGTTALLPQTATLSGTNAAEFEITSDTCAGQSIAPAGTCSASVRLVPTGSHSRNATLAIPDNTAAGARRVTVTGTGQVAPSIPQGALATPRTDRIRVSWTPPFDNGGSTISSYNIYRGTSAGTIGATPVAVVSGSLQSWDDTGLTPGATYAYSIAAVNVAGEGPRLTTSAVTVVADELVFSHDLHGWGNYALVIGDAGSGGLTTLLDDGSSNMLPAVSPDGTKVAFISDKGGTGHVWVMPLDGSAPATQLTTTAGEDDYPSWSPDGTRI
ncbi:MAG: choice-of-anchor D domain-containing protein, partial [Actinomycetota bacterium]|nr:choice-of-anchor D domain-containing protein [Actinomycetota bacterium]